VSLHHLLRPIRRRFIPNELDACDESLVAIGLASDRVIHLVQVAAQQHVEVERLVIVNLFADDEVRLGCAH